ncbi:MULTISPECIES: helix-turn-helix domain-containing protein [Actinomadura]|uniref:helix-turn-helix domain-containing protein n=1 Tax=Actinomadura TaxID=1988 RepID=UPI001BE3E306|nr:MULTISPECIES: helix-turn-helix transcriptional regulator [Actinomadura]MBT2209139.1 helix-turn-helix domain-containing protein [Actinomadura sp. NEAU-AAG7]
MTEQAHAARASFGGRLRNIRKDARLTGRQLAALNNWHFAKVSKIEHGRQNPSEDDIRAWCIACHAEEQIPELIATVRDIAQMWELHRNSLKGGQKRLQAKGTPLYKATRLLRAYESICPPGILQSPSYVRAVMEVNASMFGLADDINAAVEARLERQSLLYSSEHRYSFVIEHGALTAIMGSVETMLEQLDFLDTVTRLPSVSFGIIPPHAIRRIFPGEGFYIFDDSMARTSTYAGRIRTVEPQDVAFMVRTFQTLQSQAVYGDKARELIDQRREEIEQLRATS